MQVGLANRVLEIEDLAALVEEQELKAIESGEFKGGKYRVKNSD
jgi:hypothetical protein